MILLIGTQWMDPKGTANQPANSAYVEMFEGSRSTARTSGISAKGVSGGRGSFFHALTA